MKKFNVFVLLFSSLFIFWSAFAYNLVNSNMTRNNFTSSSSVKIQNANKLITQLEWNQVKTKNNIATASQSWYNIIEYWPYNSAPTYKVDGQEPDTILQYSPNGKNFSFVVWKWEKQILLKDWKEINWYDLSSHPVYSPDNKSFAFVAWKKWKWFLIIKDGVESDVGYAVVSTPVYSPDGKNFVYLAKTFNWWNVIVKNWVISNASDYSFANFFISSPIYSSDNKSFAFKWRDTWKTIVVKDGVKSKGYDDISNLTYSPDGKNFSFMAKENWKLLVVKDGVESNKYRDVVPGKYGPYFSSDSKNFTFVALREGDPGSSNMGVIVKNGVEIINWYNQTWYPTFSPDEKNFSYVAVTNKKSFIVKDGVKGNEYDGIWPLAYSPDGKNFAFIAKENWKFLFVKDGVESKRYDYMDELIFSPDSKSFVFNAKKDGKWFIVKDGIESSAYNQVFTKLFSSDSKSFAFLATKWEKWLFVKDGVESELYDNIGNYSYSPDGRNFVFTANKDGKWFIVSNGIENLSSYDSIKNVTHSSDSSEFSFIATRGEKIFVVTYSIKDGNFISSLAKESVDGVVNFQSQITLSEKTLQAIKKMSEKINGLSSTKKAVYIKNIELLLKKEKEWTTRYVIIITLLQNLQYVPSTNLAIMRTEMLDIINNERVKIWIQPLRLNNKLNEVAQSYSEYMYENKYLNHIMPDGTKPSNRIARAGYTWLITGENIAKWYMTAIWAMDWWMNSSGHREIILNADFSEVGIGFSHGYWTQNFGAPEVAK